MRVFELAQRLDVPAGALMARMNHLEIEAKSVLKSIDNDVMRRLLEDFRANGNGVPGTPDPSLVEDLLSAMNGGARELESAPDPAPSEDLSTAVDETPTTEPATTPDEIETVDETPTGDPQTTPDDTEVVDQTPTGEDGKEVPSPETKPPLTDGRRHGRPSGWSAWADADDASQSRAEPTDDQPGPDRATVPSRDEDESADSRVSDRQGTLLSRYRSLSSKQRIALTGVVILVGVTLLTTLYALMRPTYAAESDVVIAISGLGSEEIERELESLSVVAESQTVLVPVAEQFDMSVAELREAFESSIVGGSSVLRFTVTASDPESALTLNEAIVDSYLGIANQPVDLDELEFVRNQVTALQEEVDGIDAELTTLESQEATNTALWLPLETELNVTQARLADLEGRLVDFRASGDAPSGSINFVEGQIDETEARLGDLVAESQTLEAEFAGTQSAANRLRDERSVIRAEMSQLEAIRVQLELDQIAGTRVAILAPGHVVDDPVGLTPTRALALGLLVGGALAFAWVVAATQLRRRR